MNVTLHRILSLALLLLCLLPLAARAQDFPPDLKDKYLQGWQNLGPNNLGGPTRGLHVSPNGTVWAGASGGGLWKSTNQGVSWQQVEGFNVMPEIYLSRVISVSTIAEDVSNGTIYVGTGDIAFLKLSDEEVYSSIKDGPAKDSPGKNGYIGTGVYVSTDGGQTFNNYNASWQPLYQTNYDVEKQPFTGVQKIIARNGRVIIATLQGIYYSDDKLATVTKAGGSDTTHLSLNIMDLEFGAGNIVYATSRNSLYISYDNGETFNVRLTRTDFPRPASDPLANPNNRSRMDVAVAPSNPDVVYVSEINANGEFLGMWRLSNSTTWRQVVPRATNIGTPFNTAFSPTLDQLIAGSGQGHYSYVMTVDPQDSNRVIFGGQQLFEYTPAQGIARMGNFSFLPNISPSTYVPFYLFNIAFDPSNPNRLYLSSLREMVVSENRGYNNYRIAVGNYSAAAMYSATVTGTGKLIALGNGMGLVFNDNQNNTSAFRLSQPKGKGIIRASIFSPDHVMLSQPGGIVQRSINGGDNFENSTGYPKVDWCDSVTFMDARNVSVQNIPFTPMVLDEVVDEATIGADSDLSDNPVYVYTTDATGLIFTIFNPFGGQDSIPTVHALNKGALLAAMGTASPSAMAVSGDTTHTLFVGTSQGQLFRFDRAHDPTQCTGVQIAMPAGSPKRWISSIAVHPKDPNIIVLTYGSPRANDASNPTNIWWSRDAMSATPSFSSLQEGLPNMPIYCSLIDPLVDNATDATWLMVGTDYGIWYITDFVENDFPIWYQMIDSVGTNGNTDFTALDGELNVVPVFDLFYQKWSYSKTVTQGQIIERLTPDISNRLYAVTYGRGIFRARRILTSVDPGLDQTTFNGNKATMPITAYPNPSNSDVNLSIKMPAAGEFSAVVYGLDGRVVSEIPAQTLSAGGHKLQLPGASEWPAGIYIVKVTAQTPAGNFTGTTKVVTID